MLAKKPKGAVQKRTPSGTSGLMWMFVGVILTLMIGFGLYLWNPLYKDEAASTPEHSTVQPINSSNSESDEYEFYDLLPEQEITGLPEDAIDAIVRDSLPSNDADALEPDFVVNVPSQDDNGVNTVEDGEGAIGDNAANPTQGQNGVAAGTPINNTTANGTDNDNSIIIVEESGTYDDPSAPATNSTARPNSGQTGQPNQTSQNNTTGAPASGANTTSQNKQQRKTYILQINSYSSAEEADKRRAQVILAGIDAHVVIKRQPNGQILYQVVSNQMTDRQAVIAKQQKLQNNGIGSLIVEQRHS